MNRLPKICIELQAEPMLLDLARLWVNSLIFNNYFRIGDTFNNYMDKIHPGMESTHINFNWKRIERVSSYLVSS